MRCTPRFLQLLRGSWLIIGDAAGVVNWKTNLHKYEQKNGVGTQAHERRRPAFEQEPGSLLPERLLQNFKYPFLARLHGNVE